MKDEQNSPPQGIDRTEMFGAREGGEGIIRCDACPVLCRIRPGRSGACDRYANADGQLIRTDPLVLAQRTRDEGGESELIGTRSQPQRLQVDLCPAATLRRGWRRWRY